MAKRKVGELFGKPIVQGGEDNTLTVNEILLQEEGNKITLSERDSDKVKSITNKRTIYFQPGNIISDELVSAFSTLVYLSNEFYYKDFQHPLNMNSVTQIQDYRDCIIGISDDYIVSWSENHHAYKVTYSTIENKIQEAIEGLSPEEKATFLSWQIYKD